jgi:hypothetical protein
MFRKCFIVTDGHNVHKFLSFGPAMCCAMDLGNLPILSVHPERGPVLFEHTGKGKYTETPWITYDPPR